MGEPEASPAITPRRAVWTLGITQLVGYGCTSYLPATLAAAQGQTLGVSTAFVFGAFLDPLGKLIFLPSWIPYVESLRSPER